MLTRTRLTTALFGLGAAISGTCAFLNIRALVEMYEAGAGGQFSTSGAIDVLEYVVPAAIAFWLAMRLRKGTGRVQLLRRAHQLGSFTMVALVVLLAAATILGAFNSGIDGVWYGVLIGAFIAGAIWQPVQVFFVAVFAGLLINQGTPAREFDAGLADRLNLVGRIACMGPNRLTATSLDWCLEARSSAVDV